VAERVVKRVCNQVENSLERLVERSSVDHTLMDSKGFGIAVD
jgi:hypothetical protein